MKILLILDTAHGQIGGTELVTLSLARALATAGHHPVVAEVGKPLLGEQARANGIELILVSADNFSDVNYRDWKRLLAAAAPDLVVRSKGWIGCANWRLDVAVMLHRIPYLSIEHHPASLRLFHSSNAKSGPVYRLRRRMRDWLHVHAVRHTVAVSDAVRLPLVQQFGFSPGHVTTMYPGIDFTAFAVTADDRGSQRDAWGIPRDAIVVGSVGRLVPHKRNDFVLQIFALLRKSSLADRLWCVIAGRGPDIERLRTIAIDLGVSDRVRFPGWQPSVSRAWSALDLFLMPSDDEGLGLTIIEAIACGCMAIPAANGGMKEILGADLGQYCINSTDAETWADAAEQFLALPSSRRAELQRRALETVKQRFNADTQWQAYKTWIELHSGRQGYAP